MAQRPKMAEDTPSASFAPKPNEYWHHLNSLLQSRKLEHILGGSLQKSGPDHKPTWTFVCMSSSRFNLSSLARFLQQLIVDDKRYGSGTGPRKTAAKNDAARKVYRHFFLDDPKAADLNRAV
jgi:dsRNA-specific ribonuclease